MAFRHISEALDGVLCGLRNELGGDLGSNARAEPGPFEGNEIHELGCIGEEPPEAGGPDWRQKCRAPQPYPSTALTPSGASGPETAPARWPARESLGLKLVIANGRADRTATKGFPKPAARLFVIAMDGERVHAAMAFGSSN